MYKHQLPTLGGIILGSEDYNLHGCKWLIFLLSMNPFFFFVCSLFVRSFVHVLACVRVRACVRVFFLGGGGGGCIRACVYKRLCVLRLTYRDNKTTCHNSLLQTLDTSVRLRLIPRQSRPNDRPMSDEKSSERSLPQAFAATRKIGSTTSDSSSPKRTARRLKCTHSGRTGEKQWCNQYGCCSFKTNGNVAA